MAPTYPTPRLTNGTVVDDVDWDQLGDNIDDLNSRLGIVEGVTTNTSGVVGIGNQRLSDRLGAGITTSATADARFGAGVGTGSNVTTGSAASQLADLRSRATALESGKASGDWQAANSTQNIAYATNGSLTTCLFATAVTPAVGLSMNTGTGVVTVLSGYAGWYDLSAQFDINCANATSHKVVLSIVNGANTITHAADNEYLPTSGYSSFNAAGPAKLAVGDTFKVNLSVHTGTGSGNYTNTGPGTGRTSFKAVWLRP